MTEQLVIDKYCIIKNNAVVLDNNIIYQDSPEVKFNDFIKGVYKNQNLNYLKFFKMDSLSKLGFINCEILIKNDSCFQSYNKEEFGIVIENSTSSLDTDINYNETIKNRAEYFPSPAVFVYTLPNIMIGEICIKHKIKGENAFFVFENFNYDFINNYVSDLFLNNKIRYCITGWVDLIGEDYFSILYLIKRRKDCLNNSEKIIFDTKNLKAIYLNK